MLRQDIAHAPVSRCVCWCPSSLLLQQASAGVSGSQKADSFVKTTYSLPWHSGGGVWAQTALTDWVPQLDRLSTVFAIPIFMFQYICNATSCITLCPIPFFVSLYICTVLPFLLHHDSCPIFLFDWICNSLIASPSLQSSFLLHDICNPIDRFTIFAIP